MQTSPISVKTSNNMIENRPKNILCITIYRSNKVLNRQIRLAFAYIPEVDNLWKQKKNPSEGFNSPRRPARARCLSAHRLTWSYNTIWSSPLTNAYWYSEAWPYAMTPSTDQMLHHIMNLWPTFTFFILQYVSIEHYGLMWPANKWLIPPDQWPCPI